jgi:hypothetical protein
MFLLFIFPCDQDAHAGVLEPDEFREFINMVCKLLKQAEVMCLCAILFLFCFGCFWNLMVLYLCGSDPYPIQRWVGVPIDTRHVCGCYGAGVQSYGSTFKFCNRQEAAFVTELSSTDESAATAILF